MLWLLVAILVILAIVGGVTVHNLLWLVLVAALIAALVALFTGGWGRRTTL